MRTSVVAAAIALGIVTTACGTGDTEPPVAADGSVITLPAPADGPVPDLPVEAAAASSPLPNIAVRRINGEGGWAQLKNELPAERALLVWFWAPH